jgi:hypothetical protein
MAMHVCHYSNCMSGIGKFMNGISSVTDSPRPGQAHPVGTPEGIAAVEAIVKENRRVTVNEMAAYLSLLSLKRG